MLLLLGYLHHWCKLLISTVSARDYHWITAMTPEQRIPDEGCLGYWLNGGGIFFACPHCTLEGATADSVGEKEMLGWSPDRLRILIYIDQGLHNHDLVDHYHYIIYHYFVWVHLSFVYPIVNRPVFGHCLIISQFDHYQILSDYQFETTIWLIVVRFVHYS